MARHSPLSAAKRKREADKRKKRQEKLERRARRSEEKARAREVRNADNPPQEDDDQSDRV